MKGCIICIGRPRETVWIIDLEVVPAGVCGVTVTTNQEKWTEIGTFGVSDKPHHWEKGVNYINFFLDAEDAFEREGPRWLKQGSYFVGL